MRYLGEVALPWVEFLVARQGAKAEWVAETDLSWEDRAGASKYLNSSGFGPEQFPLPGDIEM
eukprot:scaffold371341_cov37-Prasinocladus_malaysianus.AAC.1